MTTQNDPQLFFKAVAKFEQKGYKPFWFVHYKIDLSSSVNDLKKRVAAIQQYLKTSEYEVFEMIFLAGLATLEWEQKTEENDNFFGDTSYMARKRKLSEIRAQRDNHREDMEILESFGNDHAKYKEWAISTGQNEEEVNNFLGSLSFNPPKAKVYDGEHYKEWLKDYLADRRERHTNEIKEAMINTGVIKTEEEWSYVKVVASREGISGATNKQGYWKLP